jgi:hypothetical protein
MESRQLVSIHRCGRAFGKVNSRVSRVSQESSPLYRDVVLVPVHRPDPGSIDRPSVRPLYESVDLPSVQSFSFENQSTILLLLQLSWGESLGGGPAIIASISFKIFGTQPSDKGRCHPWWDASFRYLQRGNAREIEERFKEDRGRKARSLIGCRCFGYQTKTKKRKKKISE